MHNQFTLKTIATKETAIERTEPASACPGLAIHINLNSPQKQLPPAVDNVQCPVLTYPAVPSHEPIVGSTRTTPNKSAQSIDSRMASPRRPPPARVSPSALTQQKEQLLEMLNLKCHERSAHKNAEAAPTNIATVLPTVDSRDGIHFVPAQPDDATGSSPSRSQAQLKYIQDYLRNPQHSEEINENSPNTIKKLVSYLIYVKLLRVY